MSPDPGICLLSMATSVCKQEPGSPRTEDLPAAGTCPQGAEPRHSRHSPVQSPYPGLSTSPLSHCPCAVSCGWGPGTLTLWVFARGNTPPSPRVLWWSEERGLEPHLGQHATQSAGGGHHSWQRPWVCTETQVDGDKCVRAGLSVCSERAPRNDMNETSGGRGHQFALTPKWAWYLWLVPQGPRGAVTGTG